MRDDSGNDDIMYAWGECTCGESETTMAEELAVENNSVARAVASYYYDYDCTSYTKVGHVTTAGTTMTLIYNASTKGKVKITVKDSSGNIKKNVLKI